LFRCGLLELLVAPPPPPDVLPVPQATSSGPPKASAPPTAESRRKSRLDLREKMVISSPLLSIVSRGCIRAAGWGTGRRRQLEKTRAR
jgi:hypothetical protein